MFAGIVEGTAVVRQVDAVAQPSAAGGSVHRIAVELPAEITAESPHGASIALNGVCLTLMSRESGWAWFEMVPETWRLTNLHAVEVGGRVNYERSLCVGDRIDGHFVQGHVDGVARVVEVENEAGEWKLWFAPPAALMKYLVPKGSITLDGVSLTLVDVLPDRASVVLIPTTLDLTVLGKRAVGALINVETDILTRTIVERLEALHDAGAIAAAARAGAGR